MKTGTRTLLLASFVNNVGGGIYWPFLSLHLYDLGASYLQVALLDSLAAIMYVTSRAWGAASDYYGTRKPFIVVGTLLSAVPIFLCGLANSPSPIIALFMISSFFGSISFPSLLAALTAVEEKGRVIGWYSMLTALGWALGTFSMGFIYESLSVMGIYAVAATLIVLSALVVALYPRESRVSRGKSLRDYVRGAFSFRFKAPKAFVWLLIAMFVCWFGFQWSGPLLRLRFYDLLQRSKVMLGIVWGVSASVSGAFVSPLAGRLADRVGGGRMLQATVLIYAFYTPLFAFVDNALLFSILWIVPIWTFNWVAAFSTPAQMTSESVRGEAMGALNTAIYLGVMLGVMGGVFADAFNRELGILITPLFFVVSWIALLPLVRFYKNHPSRAVISRRETRESESSRRRRSLVFQALSER